jgi:hypothetical protein
MSTVEEIYEVMFVIIGECAAKTVKDQVNDYKLRLKQARIH